MNAVAPQLAAPGRSPSNPVRRSLAMLRACAPSPALRLLCLAAVALPLVGAAPIDAYAPGPERSTIGAVMLVSFAVAVPWGLWFSRLLLLRMEAHAWRMPALPAAIPVAIAHLLLGTVAIPAALLVLLAGAEPVFALSCLMLAAMAALVAAMLPRWCYLAACFVPLAWAVLGVFAVRIWGLDALKVDTAVFASWQLPYLAALAAFAAAWRWRAIVRNAGSAPSSPWRLPAVLSSQRSVLWGNPATADALWLARMPDWLLPTGLADQTGPARPLRAMRAILGPPFAPLTRTQIAVQAGMVVLGGVVFVLASTSNLEQDWIQSLLAGSVPGGLGGGGLVLVTLYGWRLEMLRRRPAGELAELALLPCWGNARRTRQTLMAAVLRPLLVAAGWTTAILAAICIVAGIDALGMAWLLAAVVGLCLLALLACLRPLSGKAMLSPWMLGLMALAMVMVMSTAVVLRPERGHGVAWLAIGWAGLYLACGIGLAQAWRRFRGRPHPFLQD